jgi:hypothetical protein
VRNAYLVKDLVKRGTPFDHPDAPDDEELLTHAVKLRGWWDPTAGQNENVDEVESDNAAQPSTPFDYDKLRGKYPWAKWDLDAEGKRHILPHQIVGKLYASTLIGVLFDYTLMGVVPGLS